MGKGHRFGGLFLLWGLAVAGGPPAAGPGPRHPRPVARFGRPLEMYRQLGLMTGTDDFPAVASVAALAGPADSTLLLLGLSLPNAALRFQRDGRGFTAAYIVTARLVRDSQLVARVDRQETVRVADFSETARSEESVLFQAGVPLEPGVYELSLRVRDALSAQGFEAVDTVDARRFGATARRVAPPLVVYEAAPRERADADPRLILNPRHTVSYGGPVARVYVEAYGDSTAMIEVRGDAGARVWTGALELQAGRGLSAGVLELPPDSLPLGRFWITATAGGPSSEPVPLLVAISDSWLVANLDEVLDLLRYIATEDELATLQEGSAQERRQRWDAFWAARDPVPATPENEFRETIFDRIRFATQQFAEAGRPGWRTDRGEVYIVLGPPTRFVERQQDRRPGAAGAPDTEEWVYERLPEGGGLRLIFLDRNGLGMYELDPASETAFRSVARRLRERQSGR
jgi:GWxTD domain-containing protein